MLATADDAAVRLPTPGTLVFGLLGGAFNACFGWCCYCSSGFSSRSAPSRILLSGTFVVVAVVAAVIDSG